MKKIICFIFILVCVSMNFSYGEEVVVALPEFDVSINGSVIDNSIVEFPFITYKGITYMPMTWDYSSALGLGLKWSNETGLKINKKNSRIVFESKGGFKNDIFKKYSATIVSSDVNVNGKDLDNSSEKYPILNFRNITYFPMTYDFMAKEFGAKYTWDNDKGLSVIADDKLQVIIPEPHVFTETFYKKDLEEKGIISSKYFRIIPTNYDDYSEPFESFDLIINYNQNDSFNNHLFDLTFAYYDNEDKFIYTKNFQTGKRYYSGKSEYLAYLSHERSTVRAETNFNKVKVMMTFRGINAVLESIKDDKTIIEYVNYEDFNKEKILESGGVYFERIYNDILGYREPVKKSIFKYSLIKHISDYSLEDGTFCMRYYIIDVDGNEIYEMEKVGRHYTKITDLKSLRFIKENIMYYMEISDADNQNLKISCNIVKVYDENKELIKIYVNESDLNLVD